MVSGDSHVNEPRNLWRDNLPPTLRSQAMRGIKPGEPGNWELILDGQQLGVQAEAEEERLRVNDPQHRYAVMRDEGIVGECIFPTTGLYVWLLAAPEVQAASCRVYNDWIADGLGQLPRFKCAGLVPSSSVDAAIAEVGRIADAGLGSVMIPAYPTDSGLLAKGVAKLTKTVGAIKAAGLARRTRFRDRTRSVRKRAHQIAAWLRRRSGEAKDEVLTLTGELATIAEATIKEAQNVAINARRGLRRAGEGASGKATSLVAQLEQTISVLETIVAQTRTRIAGEVPDGATRVVSLHDTEARPIAKGRLGRPVEFGFKG